MFRLAGYLGMTVAELETRMDSEELSEWAAYFKLHPLFDPWYAVGIVCSTFVNLFRGKGQRPVRPEKFMPKAPIRPMSAKQMMGVMSAYVR